MDHVLSPELYPIHLIVARIFTDRPFNHSGTGLRRAVTAGFPDDPLLHHHKVDGASDYSLPTVRYLVVDNLPLLVGLGEGRETVISVAGNIEQLVVGRKRYTVVGHDFIEDGVYLGMTPELTTYKTLTPWLALNQKNVKKFNQLKTDHEKRRLLERILTGNILSLAKGLGFHVNAGIAVKIISFSWRKIHTPQPLLGFQATFVSNVIIPEFLGLGKLVSKGFGLMITID